MVGDMGIPPIGDKMTYPYGVDISRFQYAVDGSVSISTSTS